MKITRELNMTKDTIAHKVKNESVPSKVKKLGIVKKSNETGLMYEYRKMMSELGIHIYKNGDNRF